MTHAEMLEGYNAGDWVWCLHCNRVYKVGEFRLIKGIQYCPYEDCDGDTVFDAWLWEEFRKKTGKKHPEKPQREVIYLLHQ